MTRNMKEKCSFITELTFETFKCDTCNEILKTPVKVVKDFGIVCGECAKNKKQFTSLSRYDDMVNNLLLPCRYAPKGCTEKNPYSALNDHEMACSYVPVRCIKNECTWKSSKQELPQHFANDHKDDVVTKIDTRISFNLDLNKAPCNILKFLEDGYFLLCELVDNIFSYAIYRIEDDGESTAILRLFGKAQKTVEIKMECNILLLTAFYEDEENHNSASVSVSGIKAVLDGSDLTMMVEIPPILVPDLRRSSKMLEDLDCPICKKKMKPPIYQCKLGHSFCHDCLPNLSACPDCKSRCEGKINTIQYRNFNLESHTLNVYYPCKYKDKGCKEILNGYSMNVHETMCAFKCYSCPLDDFKGFYDDFKAHIMTSHKEMFIEESYYEKSIRKNTLFSEAFFIYNQETMFYIHFECMQLNDESLTYSSEVTVVMNHEVFKYYSCKVGISNSKVTSKLSETKNIVNELNEKLVWNFPESLLTNYEEEMFMSIVFKETPYTHI